MHLFNTKPLLTLLIYTLLVFTIAAPNLSYGYYSGRHYGSYGHSGHSSHYRYNRYGRHNYYPKRSYRRSYSRYPRQRYYSNYRQYPRSYSFTVPSNFGVYSSDTYYQQLSTKYSAINSSAWQSLAQGQYREALGVFANEAQSHPNSGVPKAGYAIASAAAGDLNKGVWAMKRAFRIDPDSLHYLQLNETNNQLINDLIEQYTIQKKQGVADQDFMISALYYLNHNYLAANQSILDAKVYANNNESMTNLHRLISQQINNGEKY